MNLEPPGILRGYGLTKWEELTKQHKRRLKTMNLDLLAAYCAAYGRWMEAEEWLAAGDGVDRSVVTLWDDKGNIKSHGVSPQVKVSRDAVKEMQRLAAVLML